MGSGSSWRHVAAAIRTAPARQRLWCRCSTELSGADANEADEATPDDFSARVGLVALRGTFTVASSKSLIDILGADIAEHEVVIIDFSDTVYIDNSAAMLVEYLIDTAVEAKTEVIVMGLSGAPATSLRALNALQSAENRFVPTLTRSNGVSILLKLPEPK